MYETLIFAIQQGDLDNFKDSELIEALERADDRYYNDNNDVGSYLEDGEYDALRMFTYQRNPSHVYFTGVGSEVRGGKVKLPYEMGSLDQVEIGDITDWVGNWSLQSEDVVVTDKLDGTSAMSIYGEDGNLQIAYSRGNGVEGADITRHIKQFENCPDNVGGPMDVRGEVIFTKEGFQKVKKVVKPHSGKNKEYKNARNMTAGIMNRKDQKGNEKIIFSNIHFVAYQILGFEGSKEEMLQTLKDAGFMTPVSEIFGGRDLTDKMLAAYLEERREETQYEIDGIVIDADSTVTRKRMNPTRDTLNPAYSIKYKVADASNVAVVDVIDVVWKASKHGFLKPRVNIVPTDLVGVTISFATGFNAKFINDKGIGPGAKVQITRSGDVIPYIQKVVKSAKPSMPEAGWDWNETGVDIVLRNRHNDSDVMIGQLVAFFTSIDAPTLKEGSIKKLYAAGFRTPEDIIKLYPAELVNVIGANGKKIHTGLQKVLKDIPYYKLFGAHASERGIGVRKIKKLQDAIGVTRLKGGGLGIDEIASVPGFERTTAKKIALDWMRFQAFLSKIDGYYTIEAEKAVGTKLAGQKIVFSGFRDKDLQDAVEQAGGIMQSALSGKTTILVVKDPNGNSTKIKKARTLGTKIMSVDDFRSMV